VYEAIFIMCCFVKKIFCEAETVFIRTQTSNYVDNRYMCELTVTGLNLQLVPFFLFSYIQL